MPIHLMPTRRDFLSGLALGGASTVLGGGLCGRLVAAGAEADVSPSGYIALLADTHIDADPLAEKAGATKYNMAKNLQAAVADVLRQPEPPKAVFVVGDLAHSVGMTGDYERFLSLIHPLREFGVPVHLALGNHDDRAEFLGVLKPESNGRSAVESRYVGVADAAGLRLVVLDSLDAPKQVGGRLRNPQRAWLAKTLDAQPRTPTIVLVHHNPAVKKEDAEHSLADAEELLAILRPRAGQGLGLRPHAHLVDPGRRGPAPGELAGSRLPVRRRAADRLVPTRTSGRRRDHRTPPGRRRPGQGIRTRRSEVASRLIAATDRGRHDRADLRKIAVSNVASRYVQRAFAKVVGKRLTD